MIVATAAAARKIPPPIKKMPSALGLHFRVRTVMRFCMMVGSLIRMYPWQTMGALSKAGYLMPVLAGWLPNLVFGAVGLGLLTRVERI